MRYTPFFLFVMAALVGFTGCKKNTGEDFSAETSFTGTWELHQTYSGMSPLMTHPEGNGKTLNFDGNHYTYRVDGQVVEEGSYTLESGSYTDVNSCATVQPANGEINTIVMGSGNRVHFEKSGSLLKITSGCIPADGGWSVYRKLKGQGD